MTTLRLASLRPAASGILALAVSITVAACGTSTTSPTPRPTAAPPSEAATPTPEVTPVPTPTPEPTPRYTNEPDSELAALVPTEVAGIPVIVPDTEEFALTPGDVSVAYGDIGDRFASLVVAYVEQPRTSLYAMRVDGEPVATADLEPHLATAGRYVGIAGLDPDPWERASVGGHVVWVRPEDNATALGTMIYTWSSGEFVFLLIGVDDAVNRAIVEALPGEAAPTPTPVPSASAGASEDASAAPSGSAAP